MGRPRSFDETATMDLVVRQFWARGFEATSVRDRRDVFKANRLLAVSRSAEMARALTSPLRQWITAGWCQMFFTTVSSMSRT